MKKENIGEKLVILMTAVVLCLAGCAAEEPVSANDVEAVEEMESESQTQENPTEQTEALDKEQEPAGWDEQISFVQTDFKVQEMLEEAEKEAEALEKKLQEDPSLTQADMNELSSEIYMVWDDALNELWKALKDSLDEATMESLLEEQRAWITEKEAEVKQAGEEVGGGSLAPLVANQRAADLTRVRVYELAGYLGYEGTLIEE